MSDELYTGPVCYRDGWHWTVIEDAGGDVPGERLFSNGDGTYRLAGEDDASHHDQFHQRFATIELEDDGGATRVTPEELEKIQAMLRESRGQDETEA